MSKGRVFVYAEYQVSVPFEQLDWGPVNEEMLRFPGLRSKTWLSGVNTRSVGGFYEFDCPDDAQRYIDELLVPFASRVGGNLSVRIFDAEVTADASRGMKSPYY